MVDTFWKTFSVEIIARLHENAILDKLYTREIITVEDQENISNLDTRKNRRKLVQVLRTKDPALLDEIIEIIETNTACKHDLVHRMKQFNAKHTITIQPQLRNILFGVSVNSLPHNFTGRDRELRVLHEMVLRSHGNSRSAITLLTSLSGLGGIGKTTLAMKYAYEYAEFFHGNVLWINAESADSTAESFLNLAGNLGIPTKTDENGHLIELENLITKLYTLFQTCLFIYDNLEDRIEQFIPKISNMAEQNKPYILITSRRNNLVPWNQVLQLDVLTQEEAKAFVLSEIPKASSSDANQLVEELQRLPLALQQATAYIQHRLVNAAGKSSIQKYLDKFRTNSIELLADVKFNLLNEYSKTTLVTWRITLEKIRNEPGGQLAIKLIQLMAFLNPDKITVDSLVSFFSSLDLDESIILLKTYSMIQIEGSDCRIHRLVQEVVRGTLKQDEEISILRSLIEGLSLVFKSHSFTSITKESTLHGLYSYKYIYKVDNLLREYVNYPTNLCFWLTRYGNYQDALKISLEIAEKYKVLFGPAAELTLKIVLRTALSHYWMQDYDASMSIYQHLHEDVVIAFGEKHPLSNRILGSIATVYIHQGEVEKAIEINDQVIAVEMELLAQGLSRHTNVLTAMNSKGLALSKLDKNEDSMKILEKVEKERAKILGKHHPDTLNTSFLIAEILFREKRLKESLDIFRRVAKGRESTLGKNHPWAINCQHSITLVEGEIKCVDEASKTKCRLV